MSPLPKSEQERILKERKQSARVRLHELIANGKVNYAVRKGTKLSGDIDNLEAPSSAEDEDAVAGEDGDGQADADAAMNDQEEGSDQSMNDDQFHFGEDDGVEAKEEPEETRAAPRPPATQKAENRQPSRPTRAPAAEEFKKKIATKTTASVEKSFKFTSSFTSAKLGAFGGPKKMYDPIGKQIFVFLRRSTADSIKVSTKQADRQLVLTQEILPVDAEELAVAAKIPQKRAEDLLEDAETGCILRWCETLAFSTCAPLRPLGICSFGSVGKYYTMQN